MKPWEIRKMRHAGKTLDTLLLDPAPPHYLIGAGYHDTVDTSPLASLDDIEGAFRTLKTYFNRGGHFLLYRRRYLALDGEVHHLFDDSFHQQVSEDFLSRNYPWPMAVPSSPAKHTFELWHVDIDTGIHHGTQGFDQQDALEHAILNTEKGLYLGLEVMAGCFEHSKV